jgi:hypothetical protein
MDPKLISGWSEVLPSLNFKQADRISGSNPYIGQFDEDGTLFAWLTTILLSPNPEDEILCLSHKETSRSDRVT